MNSVRYIWIVAIALVSVNSLAQEYRLDRLWSGQYSWLDYNELVDVTGTDQNVVTAIGITGSLDTNGYNQDITFYQVENGEETNSLRFDFNGCDYSTAIRLLHHENDIYIIGTGYSFSNTDRILPCVMKLRENGTADISFAVNGTSVIPAVFVPTTATVHANNIYLGGYLKDSTDGDFWGVIAKLNLNGTPDQDFGNEGVLKIDLGFLYSTRHLIGGAVTEILGIDESTLLIAGGYSPDGVYDSFFITMDTSGTVDTNKSATVSISESSNDQIQDLKMLPNGKIAFTASMGELYSTDFIVGVFDPLTFNYHWVKIDYNEGDDYALGLELWGDNGLLVWGNTVDLENITGSGYRSDRTTIIQFPDWEDLTDYHLYDYQFDHTYQNGMNGGCLLDDGSLALVGFSYYGIGWNQINSSVMVLKAGVEPASDQLFSAYPNPSAGTFNLLMDTEIDESVLTVSNLAGQVLKTAEYNAQQNVLTLDLPNGIYFLTLNANDEVQTLRIVITR